MSLWVAVLKVSYLAAECADVLGVLGDFHLFDGFTEGSTITGSIFTDDSDLLGAFSLENMTRENFNHKFSTNFILDPISNLPQIRNVSIWILSNRKLVNVFLRCHRYIQIFDWKNFSPLFAPRISRGKGSCWVSWCHRQKTNNNKSDKRARKFKLPLWTTKEWWLCCPQLSIHTTNSSDGFTNFLYQQRIYEFFVKLTLLFLGTVNVNNNILFR